MTIRRLRSSLWFVPVMCVFVGLLVSFGTIAIDRAFDYELIPTSLTGGPDDAVAILSTIAASMVSLAALVLTITMVVVQLAMGQFSPRIVQTFLRDKPSQIAIGLFIGTFAHAMLTLREVNFEANHVPGLAIAVAYILVLISIAVLVLYVHHIGQSLRVSALIELVGSDTRRLLDEQYPPFEGEGTQPPDRRTIVATKSGVVREVHHHDLVEVARQADCQLTMVPALGEYVAAGAPMFRVEGDGRRVDVEGILDGVVLGLERTLDHDVAYGLRMLVDMGERSISESPFQDPTTTVQALDRLHECLRHLANRRFPDGDHRDDQGTVRLSVPVMDWDAYVTLAFEEIVLAGAGSPQVSRRLTAAFDDLLGIAPPERRPAVERQRDLLEAAHGEVHQRGGDGSFDLRADRQGIGVKAARRRIDVGPAG